MTTEKDEKTDIALLKQGLEQTNRFLTRCDKVLEKLSTVSTDISKILAVHENKLNTHGEAIEEVQKGLFERQKELTEFNSRIDTTKEELRREFTEKFSEADMRLSALEKWRWHIAGVIIFIAFVVSRFDFTKLVLGTH